MDQFVTKTGGQSIFVNNNNMLYKTLGGVRIRGGKPSFVRLLEGIIG